jgi:curved DNA-binding protein CbpA
VGKSHYDVLGVPKTSSATVITKKYRELAKKLHPDKNKKDPNAQDKFIELSKAYEVLNDDKLRREYDHDLRFGGSNQNSVRHNDNRNSQRENFYNFNDEEVFVFRTPDGRVFTRRSAQQQVDLLLHNSNFAVCSSHFQD